MAEIIKEELNIEEFEIKEEIVSNKEEILPSSTVEDTCKDDLKKENTGIQGELNNFTIFLIEMNKNVQKTVKLSKSCVRKKKFMIR